MIATPNISGHKIRLTGLLALKVKLSVVSCQLSVAGSQLKESRSTDFYRARIAKLDDGGQLTTDN